jgi:hypothetical protein
MLRFSSNIIFIQSLTINKMIMNKLMKVLGTTGLFAILFVSSFTHTVTAQSEPCEDKITYQFDDGALCEPAGTSCILIIGCPGSN